MSGEMDMDSEVVPPQRRPRRRSLPLEDDDEMNEIGRRGMNAFHRLVDLRSKQTPYAQEIVDEGRYNIGRQWDELNRQYEASASGSGSATGPGREGNRQRRNSFDTIAGDLTMGGATWSQPQQQQQEQPQQLWQHQQQQQWQQQQWQQQQQQQQQQIQQQQHQFGGELEGSRTQQGNFFGSGKRKHREVDDGYEFTSPQRHKQRRNSNSFSQLSPLFQRQQQHVEPVEGFLPSSFGMRNGNF